MLLIRGGKQISAGTKGYVATIGNFDGVHLGHQGVIKYLVDQAKRLGLPSLVILFEPHPQEFFATKDAVPRLYTFRDKYERIAALGVDTLLCLRFDKRLAKMPAEAFITDLLQQKLKVKHLVLGDDFRFGYQRKGDFALLQAYSNAGGYQVENLSSFLAAEQRISSTLIRQALADGDCDLAGQFLGRTFTISGRVKHGDKRGRTIGFPTANIALKRKASPVSGVFAVTAAYQGQELKGVANIGQRPTINGTQAQLEVHFFDFNADLYGQRLVVKLYQKLRQEQHFASFEQLQQQICQDAEQAREILTARPIEKSKTQ